MSTRTDPVADRQNGYLAHLEFDKHGGWFETEAGLAARSPRTDINDLDFLRHGDLLPAWGEVQFFRYRSIGPSRECDLSFEGQAEWNYDRLLLEQAYDLSNWGDLPNYWEVHLAVRSSSSGRNRVVLASMIRPGKIWNYAL